MIGLIYFNFASAHIASMVGTWIFLIGIILIFLYQYFDHEHFDAFILLHWFVFLWLLTDISLPSKSKPKISTSNGMVLNLIYYFILFSVFDRLRVLYIVCKENRFHSRKVYSLIVSPRIF